VRRADGEGDLSSELNEADAADVETLATTRRGRTWFPEHVTVSVGDRS